MFGAEILKDQYYQLPYCFFLKANHGSGMAMVFDKSVHGFEKLSAIIRNWIEQDYSNYGREWFCKNLRRYVIAEAILDENGASPTDYKFFCSNDEVIFMKVDLDRFTDHTRSLYLPDFTKIDGKLLYPSRKSISKPKLWEKAISVARKLSVDFDFIGVDLYLCGEQVYFGELTNSPGNDFEKFSPSSINFQLGTRFPSVLDR
jgi:hypothetical protein